MSSKTSNRLGIMTDFRIVSRTHFKMHGKMGVRVIHNIGSKMG